MLKTFRFLNKAINLIRPHIFSYLLLKKLKNLKKGLDIGNVLKTIAKNGNISHRTCILL